MTTANLVRAWRLKSDLYRTLQELEYGRAEPNSQTLKAFAQAGYDIAPLLQTGVVVDASPLLSPADLALSLSPPDHKNHLSYPMISDEMIPTIATGDTVFYDPAQTSYTRCGLYAIEFNHQVCIRRLQLLMGHQCQLLCDNPLYTPVTSSLAEFAIKGKVTGIFRLVG
jgi:SOS-response transcriptional repressor LexA